MSTATEVQMRQREAMHAMRYYHARLGIYVAGLTERLFRWRPTRRPTSPDMAQMIDDIERHGHRTPSFYEAHP